MKVEVDKDGPVTVVTINRPQVINAIDSETAQALADAFRDFQADDDSKVAILTGAGDHFSSGLDLKAIARGQRPNLSETGDSALGPIRLRLRKPTIAAIEGYCVAGGMALALWCDLRVVSERAVFGMLDRQIGVPIFGAVTVALPRLVGLSHAMDIILTGRRVAADEADKMGMVNRLVEDSTALDGAKRLARELTEVPWDSLVADRLALLEGMDLPRDIAERNEYVRGISAFGTAEMMARAAAFARGGT